MSGPGSTPLAGRCLVPSERTFRRVLHELDGDALDAAVGGYASDVVRGVSPAPNTYRLAGRANIAHARRDLHHRADAFTAYGI